MKISVHVTPRAAHNKIESQLDGSLRVRVTTAPTDGRANAAVIKLLARHLKIAPSRLKISAGQNSRKKTILLDQSHL